MESHRLKDSENRTRVNGAPCLGCLAVLSISALCLTIAEWLARGELGAVLEWIAHHPQLAAVNLLLVLCFMIGAVALFGRIISGVLFSAAVLVLAGIVNHLKINHLQQPFLLTDLFYAKHVVSLLPMLNMPGLSASVVGPVALFGLLGMGMACRWESAIRIQTRLVLLGAASVVLASVVLHRELPRDLPAMLNTDNAVWDQRANTMTNGFLLTLALNAQPAWVGEPEDYSEDYVSLLVEGLDSSAGVATDGADHGPVSLVLFMSESFSDLRHVSYRTEESPLANFERLMAGTPSFRMASPSFGGNTSHVEFEMLTGISNYFLPDGAVPYDYFVSGLQPSLVSILRRNGYGTTAVHPYHPWFWRRDSVFPRMGFDDFISLPDFGDAPKRGWFVSDEALVDRVMEEIGKATAPYFVYALSMQNHGAYDARRYAPDEVRVEGPYPENLRLSLQTYVSGVRDADVQLGRLLELLETRVERVMVLFCGDHLPSFGKDYAVYRESGSIRSKPGAYTADEHFRMADVPCLLWANRPEILDGISIPEHLSPAYIPSLLLSHMGIEMPPHMRFQHRGIHDYPVIHRQFFWQPERGILGLDEDGEDSPFQSYLNDLEVLQYDVFWGEGYSLREWNTDA